MRMRTLVVFVLLVVCGCGGASTGRSARPDAPGGAGGAAGADAGLGGTGGGSIGGALGWSDAGLPVDTKEHSGDRVQVSDWMAGSVDLFRKELRDTAHDEACELKMAADGVRRCLPLAYGDFLFSDDQCTTQVILGAPEAQPAPFPFCGLTGTDASQFVATTSIPCSETVTSLFTRGKELPSLSATYRSDDNGCRLYGDPRGKRVFEAVPSPLDEWVGYRQSVVEITPRLGVEMWTGQDGSVVRGAPHLMQEDATCDLVVEDPRNVLAARCMPSSRTRVERGFSEDAACTQWVYAYKECGGAPLVIEGSNPPGSGCSNAPELTGLGEVVPASGIFWVFLTNPCSPAPPAATDGLRFARQGAPIPRSSFPVLTAHMEQAGGPTRLVWALDGKDVLPVDGTASTGDPQGALQGSCARYTLRDGTTVCAPWPQTTPSQTTPNYADPECATPVFIVGSSECSTSLPPDWFPDINLSDYCGDFGMRRVLGIHEGPTYQLNGLTNACEQVSAPQGTPYDLGPKVSAKDIAVSLYAGPL